MKQLFMAIWMAVRVVIGFTGFVLCFFEAPDLTTQFYVYLAGFSMIAIAVLPSLFRKEEGLGYIYE